MKFSQRMGITPSSKEIQLESIDDELRNGLWNVYISILDSVPYELVYRSSSRGKPFLTESLFDGYFKLRIDKIPYNDFDLISFIRKCFYAAKWFEVYDIIEFTNDIIAKIRVLDMDKIYNRYNQILKREFAGYRFISGELSPITNQVEVSQIEDSLDITSGITSLKYCNTHLRDALSKLSDRENPDYRNSIKESISAVESIAKVISGNAKDSLGGALDKIKGKIKLDNGQVQGFKSLYGYTSNTGGIRHALKDATDCDFEDAKYMLVSCSAFIGYLIAKCDKVGINF